MKPDNSTWLKKTWPLTLSVLAALGIGRLLPKMYSDFEFSRDGAGVAAWYTDLNQEHEVFRYAYVVGNVTYGGQASWNDADSEIYWHKPVIEYRAAFSTYRPDLGSPSTAETPSSNFAKQKAGSYVTFAFSPSAFGCTEFAFGNEPLEPRSR
jgi:hypothetical protein